MEIKELRGVWRRRSIRWPDGSEDLTTQVWWLQATPHFADLRIPADRPSFRGINSLAGCNAVQRAFLARQQGFAGVLENQKGNWIWKREMDFQPPTGKRDIGTLEYAGHKRNQLVEEGLDEPYTEIWQRMDDAVPLGQTFVMRLIDNPPGERGMLVVVGEHFILARDHGARKQTEPLDMEISHGISRGAIGQWTISESTFPWREGSRVFDGANVKLNWDRRKLIETRDWEIVEPADGKLDWIA